MMSRLGFTLVALFALSLMLILNKDFRYPITPGQEHLLRLVAMAHIGAILGLILRIGIFFFDMERDPSDILMPPMIMTLAVLFFTMIFITLHLFMILRMNFVTWRTPFVFLTFIASITILLRIKALVRRASQRAVGSVSVVMMERKPDGTMVPIDLEK